MYTTQYGNSNNFVFSTNTAAHSINFFFFFWMPLCASFSHLFIKSTNSIKDIFKLINCIAGIFVCMHTTTGWCVRGQQNAMHPSQVAFGSCSFFFVFGYCVHNSNRMLNASHFRSMNNRDWTNDAMAFGFAMRMFSIVGTLLLNWFAFHPLFTWAYSFCHYLPFKFPFDQQSLHSFSHSTTSDGLLSFDSRSICDQSNKRKYRGLLSDNMVLMET